MDTSRHHLIVRLCRAVLVGTLIVSAAACTTTAAVPSASPSHPRPAHARHGGYVASWPTHDSVMSGYLDGWWTTGELSAASLHARLAHDGFAACAAGVVAPLDGHRLILFAIGDRWRLTIAGQGRSGRLAGGRFTESEVAPSEYRASLAGDGATSLAGRRPTEWFGSSGTMTVRVKSTEPMSSCLGSADTLAWFGKPFTKKASR